MQLVLAFKNKEDYVTGDSAAIELLLRRTLVRSILHSTLRNITHTTQHKEHNDVYIVVIR